jgi:cytosine/adenosine deaminase-related metal-dependent hydrolase
VRTLISARDVVAGHDTSHAILENGQVVIDDDPIVYVGPDYAEEVDARLDARAQLLAPGSLSVHCHLTHNPLTKSFVT